MTDADLDQRAFVRALEVYENNQMRGNTIAKCIASAIGAYNSEIAQSAANHIAPAPRAFIVVSRHGVPVEITMTEIGAKDLALDWSESSVIPIALVPLTPEEAGE